MVSDELRQETHPPLTGIQIPGGLRGSVNHVLGWLPSRGLSLFLVDLLAAGASLVAAIVFQRSSLSVLYADFRQILLPVIVFVGLCALIFPSLGMYNKNWRYASIKDLVAILAASALASISFFLLVIYVPNLSAIEPGVVGIGAFILVCLLSMIRISFRIDEVVDFSLTGVARAARKDLIPVLLVEAGHSADLYLRALQRDRNASYLPVGILDSNPRNRGVLLRGVPVLGDLNDFDKVIDSLEANGKRPRHIVFTETLGRFGGSAATLIDRAERRGIAFSRLRAPTELRNPKTEGRFELRPIELTDLLERSQAALDRDALRRLVVGRRVLVTGAGGSIGKELALQIAALGPSELVLLDSCEYNLYAVELEIKEGHPNVSSTYYLCNIREENRVNEIFDAHRPELVFHAAALKHVPLVELNPCEGVLTNVIGTMHVAAAAKRTKVLAMVQVSTDKVVNPTSVMGATKRLAELYCQALDLKSREEPDGPRFMTVRFGNVLGSSGSLVPLFQRQLARGGPLTVTHPDMQRFFMTIREAVELTLQASAYGLEQCLGRGEIFVLDMGEPVRIIDVARRMIRLAGLTPDEDVKIEIVGLRPGEKLREELFDSCEKAVASPVPGVLGALPNSVELSVLNQGLSKLSYCAEARDVAGLFAAMGELLPNYRGGQRPARAPGPRPRIVVAA